MLGPVVWLLVHGVLIIAANIFWGLNPDNYIAMYVGDEIIAVSISAEIGKQAFDQCYGRIEDWLICRAGKTWLIEKPKLLMRKKIMQYPKLFNLNSIN